VNAVQRPPYGHPNVPGTTDQRAGLPGLNIAKAFNESYRAQARGHNLWTLWLSEIGSLAFVTIGLVTLSVDPTAWLISIASIVFFGGCAVVIGLMIRSRMK
jgi:hypothetical protein